MFLKLTQTNGDQLRVNINHVVSYQTHDRNCVKLVTRDERAFFIGHTVDYVDTMIERCLQDARKQDL